MVATAVSGELAVWWWSALGAGLVVALVLVLLLHWLLRVVTGVTQGLAEVWEAGKQVARNTSTTWILGQTSRALGEIEQEAGEHERVLAGGDR